MASEDRKVGKKKGGRGKKAVDHFLALFVGSLPEAAGGRRGEREKGKGKKTQLSISSPARVLNIRASMPVEKEKQKTKGNRKGRESIFCRENEKKKKGGGGCGEDSVQHKKRAGTVSPHPFFPFPPFFPPFSLLPCPLRPTAPARKQGGKGGKKKAFFLAPPLTL